jgi:hypothetical protein
LSNPKAGGVEHSPGSRFVKTLLLVLLLIPVTSS